MAVIRRKARTLRQLRRYLAKGVPCTHDGYWNVRERTVDQLISVYGPDCPVAEAMKNGLDQLGRIRSTEDRGVTAKGTDEVADSAQSDGDLHGGDGNAGEVDHPAETPAMHPRRGETTQSVADSSESGALVRGEQSPDELDLSCAEAGDSHEESPSEQGEDLPDSDDRPSVDNPEREASVAAMGDGAESESDELADDQGDGEAASLVTRPTAPKFGGWWADPESTVLANPQSVREIRRQLRRLVRRYEPNPVDADDRSPRFDDRRLAVELISRRYNLARARREELSPRISVLIADCSGSCSTVCDKTLEACRQVVLGSSNSICLKTSNETVDADGWPTITEWLDREYPGFDVGLMIIFGDLDGYCEYRTLVEAGADLVWLDSYCASYGPAPASWALRQYAADWPRQPIGWWQGVNDATSAAIALRHIARGTP